MVETASVNVTTGKTTTQDNLGDRSAQVQKKIYHLRFSETENIIRKNVWKVLCKDFLQKYIAAESTVLDLGAGDGNFIINIQAKRRIAVDISPNVLSLKQHGIEEAFVASATDFSKVLREPVDVIFMSNLLEHMPSKFVMCEVLAECQRALKNSGLLLVIQPNIRYTGAAYWDFIDHHIALTDASLIEALKVSGFEICNIIPRFLPYSAKSRLSKLARYAWIVKLYLKLPYLWRVFGKQTFVVARRTD
jgi:ubiquinone/menaquinone biosynthesis C-methylase UbiE